ncbi:hypothetical protein PV11_02482 [Exophiala sideris]|uniref:Uncharacterized protein n=1 Tax=Exophiala sideris TaxID=1016849 RepID=A0A0D1XFK4_9EURO|nr:hypothetical protein PV11_02482 [Exophiala sideris]
MSQELLIVPLETFSVSILLAKAASIKMAVIPVARMEVGYAQMDLSVAPASPQVVVVNRCGTTPEQCASAVIVGTATTRPPAPKSTKATKTKAPKHTSTKKPK